MTILAPDAGADRRLDIAAHPAGLAVRMAGENPAAVEAQGPQRAGSAHQRSHGGLRADGRGRAFLTLSAFNAFFFNMVNGPWLDLRRAGRGSPRGARAGLARGAVVRRIRCTAASLAAVFRVFCRSRCLPALPHASYLLSIVALVVMARRQPILRR